MKSILKPRVAFKPFEYPFLIERANAIRHTYWVHDEISFDQDKHEFKIDLNDTERYIIGTILKTFAQTETHVADEFWSKLVNYMPKPEVALLCAAFTDNEWRHAEAYDRLNEELGLIDYDAFQEDPVLMARMENLTKIREHAGGSFSVKDLMLTLAVFGGFTEYVNLFSQFAILRSFSGNGRNLLTNIGDIIDWSALDEQHHAATAMEIFNILKEENPELWDDELKSSIYTAASLTFEIEERLISQIFEKGELPNLKKKDLLNYMKHRINGALNRMGLKSIKNVDQETLKNLQWFEDGLNAKGYTDFFAKRVTDYTKNLVVFNKDTVKVDKDYIKNIASK
jgi:ribonucleoside-diphosphate reductase beta chain